ncbi:MAG: hypothetical protein HY223_02420 [Thaumarchaeota archaeon]|nr:hypothetical protein [Nitrososphaerota archaeon]
MRYEDQTTSYKQKAKGDNQELNGKYKWKILVLSAVITFSMMAEPAFATKINQVPPYNVYSAVPNGWSANNQAYGSASSSGVGNIYATSPTGGATAEADSYHNLNANTNVPGSQPQFTTSGSTIYYGYTIAYDVQITHNSASSGTAQYKGGSQLYENRGSGWFLAKSCIFSPVTTPGDNTNTVGTICSSSGNTGTNTWATIGINDAYTTTASAFYTNTVDAKNSPHNVQVQELVLCDQLCGL